MNKNLNSVLKDFSRMDMDMRPCVIMEDGSRIYPEYTFKINEKAGAFSLTAQHKELFKDALYFEYNKDEITCKRIFESISDEAISIKELSVEFSGITFNEAAEKDYFYHNETPRMIGFMTLPVDFDRTKLEIKGEFDRVAGNNWADPGVSFERVGSSPYQPFPAVLLSNYNVKTGIVHGSLSQRVFYHNYFIEHKDNALRLDAFSSFKDIAAMKMKKGRVLYDEWYMGRTDEADDIEKIFAGYTKMLRSKLPASYGRTSINRDNMVWGSWNDGILRDVTEELILREAKYLKENFPTVKWIQLDDGYAKYSGENNIAFGLGMPYEGEEGLDRKKFPDGLRSYADKIREIGLRPALWIGGFCPKGTKIYKEHPEWFFNYDHRIKDSAPLDVSKKEVREYMMKALDELISQNVFEGIKHDFWSYAFEDSNDLLENKEKSGYEHRDWWLKEIRKRIPADGYLQTGCDIVMANPFLGEFFTNYRYGVDIGAGNWHNVKRTYLWGMACFALHTGDLFVPNSDSIGMLPGLNDDEAYFCINYCLATHSMVEISGILSKAEHNERYRMLKKAACNPNNGQDIYFAGYDYRAQSDDFVVPEIIYFKTPHFSVVENGDGIPVRTVALFNIFENEKVLSFSAKDLGLDDGDYVLTDVWSGEQFDFSAAASVSVRPHASRLLAVSKRKGLQLYDANIRINSAKTQENAMLIENDYAVKEAELYFSKEVKAVYLNEKKLEFSKRDKNIVLDLDEKGVIRAEF